MTRVIASATAGAITVKTVIHCPRHVVMAGGLPASRRAPPCLKNFLDYY